MRKVNISQYKPFADHDVIKIIKKQFTIHTSLMPHQIASSTGRSKEEAMGFLLFLNILNVVEGQLLVYHKKHRNVPFMTLGIVEGLPTLPVICDVCRDTISDLNELEYEFIFFINEAIDFII